MSKGIVIFAYNTPKFNYIEMAAVAAYQASIEMLLPVTLITNNEISMAILKNNYEQYFSNIIVTNAQEEQHREFRFHDSIVKSVWYNKDRMSVYDLSPYDQTLLIDADYFMFNRDLAQIFDTSVDFACYDEVHDLTGQGRFNADRYLGYSKIPMQWATVIYFTKSPVAKAIFDFMLHIKKNYAYYAALYAFDSGVYRNDYALSIALQTVAGYSKNNFCKLPGKLATLDSQVEILYVRPFDGIMYRYKDKKDSVGTISHTNVHVMNKSDMSSFRDNILGFPTYML